MLSTIDSAGPADVNARTGGAVALIVGFIAIYQWQQPQTQERISDLAAMDFAVLMDETPIGAYADKGFGALLRGETEDL